MVLQKVTKEVWYWEKLNILAKEAFPPKEYLAPSSLIEMANVDDFNFNALIDNNKFIGFMVTKIHKNLCYLFFLAIANEYRSKGYGSQAIQLLKKEYPDKIQVVDFEMLDKSSNNYEQRKKRREFYLKNGYKETGLFLSYLGIDYEVFSMSDKFNEKIFKDMMSKMNIEGFNPKYFEKEI